PSLSYDRVLAPHCVNSFATSYVAILRGLGNPVLAKLPPAWVLWPSLIYIYLGEFVLYASLGNRRTGTQLHSEAVKENRRPLGLQKCTSGMELDEWLLLFRHFACQLVKILVADLRPTC